MSTIENIFRDVSRERFLANFDYIDIARGKIIQTFFLANEKQSATPTYLLNDIEFFSNDIHSHGSTANPGATLVLDVDFDSVFEMPRSIEGDIIVSIPIGIYQTDGNPSYIYIITKARKWDGASETDLDTATSETIMNDTNGTFTNAKMICMKMTVANTHFKAGETLRLTVEVYGRTDGGAQKDFCIWHDPKNRGNDYHTGAAGEPTTTQSLVLIPFVIKE